MGYADDPVVLFHAACTDGYTAAWVVHRRYPGALMIPCYHGDPVPEEAVKGRDVVLVDYSYNRSNMLLLIGLARSVLVLDHHKSAQAELSNLESATGVQIFFDMDRSGAQLAWEHFFPGIDTPELVSYVADYDLWRFDLPDSRMVNMAINSYPFDWDTWNKLAITPMSRLVSEGKAISRYQTLQIDSAVKHARYGRWHGYRVAVVNTGTHTKNDTCHRLLESGKCDVAVAWHQLADGTFKYSLRSLATGPDVSKLALPLGGGGHYSSASFLSPLSFPFD